MTCTVELRCSACGSVFVAEGDPAGAEFACPVCLASGRVGAHPQPKSQPKLQPKPQPPQPKPLPAPRAKAAAPAPRPSRPPQAENRAATSPAPAPRPAERPPSAAHLEPAQEVVCPRCKLHFTPRGSASRTDPGDRPRLLLVDRPGFLLDTLRETLGASYEVFTASSVEEARALLAQGNVDLMILDPDIEPGGEQLLPGPLRKSCPMLIYTAADEAQLYGERWEELHALGADDILVKGMNAAEHLSRKVAALLGRAVDDADEP